MKIIMVKKIERLFSYFWVIYIIMSNSCLVFLTLFKHPSSSEGFLNNIIHNTVTSLTTSIWFMINKSLNAALCFVQCQLLQYTEGQNYIIPHTQKNNPAYGFNSQMTMKKMCVQFFCVITIQFTFMWCICNYFSHRL